MTKIYDAIPSNGTLIKGEAHTQESFLKLNLWDQCFVDDELYCVVAFDENKNPQLASGKTEFSILEVDEEQAEKNHEILFSQSHPSASGGLKITAADMSVSGLDDIVKDSEPPTWKVKVRDFDLVDPKMVEPDGTIDMRKWASKDEENE